MQHQWQQYKQLELIADQDLSVKPAPQPPEPISWWKRLWRALDVALFRDLEPHSWHTVDPTTGRTRWYVYHPETGKTTVLNSEAAVRQWLEAIFRS